MGVGVKSLSVPEDNTWWEIFDLIVQDALWSILKELLKKLVVWCRETDTISKGVD